MMCSLVPVLAFRYEVPTYRDTYRYRTSPTAADFSLRTMTDELALEEHRSRMNINPDGREILDLASLMR